ncbi:hypothetical protein NT6N_07110 [Oceaniferula spumae]|uniref:Uncharacterized protein n=1 Tax=Oceaniferula spumae TaxID=2979115 RepID=A0AAT9FI84_9BACT
MSLESITPLPATSGKPVPAPSLASLRQGWSSHGAAPSTPRQQPPLPTFPVKSEVPGNKKTTPEPLPQLPELGSMASDAVFSMEGLDELLASVYPGRVKETTQQKPSLFEEPIPAVPTQQPAAQQTQKKPTIPSIELPPSGQRSARSSSEQSAAKHASMSAMPSVAAPNVSLPLVRDQFLKPTSTTPEEETTEKTTPTPSFAAKPAAESKPEPVAAKKAEPQSADPAPKQEAPTPQARPEPQPKTFTRKIIAPSSTPPESDQPFAERTSTPNKVDQTKPARPDYTDDDLRDAMQPIVDQSVDKFLYTPSHGIHTYLEPMLRSTVRRAIAEQMDDASPFHDVAGWDKFAWKMRALFSSRTYDEIVFDRTKRYQVEEVFLLRRHTRSMISYASNDPSRHSKTNKVLSTVKKVASKCGSSSSPADTESCISWEDGRNLMIRRGKHCILAAIVHGSSNAILRSDLDYALRQAEERFGISLEEENDIHLQILQPLLEGCLLIQSPAIPN